MNQHHGDVPNGAGLALQGSIRLLQHCLSVQSGDNVAIFFDETSAEAASTLEAGVLYLSAHAIKRQVPLGQQIVLATSDTIATEDSDAIGRARVIIICFDKLARTATYRKRLIAAAAGERRVLVLGGLSTEILAGPINIDYQDLSKRASDLALAFLQGQRIEVKTYAIDEENSGTDEHCLTAALGGFERPPVTNIGYIMEGSWGNLPAGDVFTLPLEGTAHGSFVVNGAFSGGTIPRSSPIILHFEAGRLVHIAGAGQQAQSLRELLFSTARSSQPLGLAQLGLGLNSGLHSLTGVPRVDQKKWGTLYIAVGDNRSYGGTLAADIHEDFVTLHPTVTIDSRPILDRGSWRLSTQDWSDSENALHDLAATVPDDFLLQRSGIDAVEINENCLRIQRETSALGLCLYYLSFPHLGQLYRLAPYPPDFLHHALLRERYAFKHGELDSSVMRGIVGLLRKHRLVALRSEPDPHIAPAEIDVTPSRPHSSRHVSVQSFLQDCVSIRLSQSRPASNWREYVVHFRDLRRLKLDVSAFVPFLVHKRPQSKQLVDWSEIVEDLTQYGREQSQGPAVFLTDQECPPSVLQNSLLRQSSVAIFDSSVLKHFLEASDLDQKYGVLGHALATSLGATALSPYAPGRPASGGRFFGRNRLLSQIVPGKTVRNCTIIGNRRIGKTSLLHEVRERLQDLYVQNKTIFFVDLYGAKLKSAWDAIYLTCSQLDVNVPKRHQKLGAISERYILRFPHLISRFTHDNDASVVLFIDEFDSFLEADARQNYRFLHILRETVSMNPRCSVLIAGFRRLMEARVRRESPYFNFTTEIAVTPLTREETFEMVTLPLSRLGIETAATNIPAMIYRETRGQPELIQMYCGSIIELFQKRRSVPTDSQLMSHVLRNPAYTRTILHTFLNNTNAYEQVLCFHLMKRMQSRRGGQLEFSLTDILDTPESVGLPLSNAQIVTLMENLVVGSVFERITGAPGRYRFALPQLLRFCQYLDLDQLLSVAYSEATRNAPTLHEINLDPESEGPTRV